VPEVLCAPPAAILDQVEAEAQQRADLDASRTTASRSEGEGDASAGPSPLRGEVDPYDEDVELGNILGDELAKALVMGEREGVRFQDEGGGAADEGEQAAAGAHEGEVIVLEGGVSASSVRSMRESSVEKLMGLLNPEAMVAPYLDRDGSREP